MGRDVPCSRLESGVSNRIALPAYCNNLQEAAGNHARELGLGIRELRDAGFTWMLSRLRLAVEAYAAWRDAVCIRTWPSGIRGRLIATRDFDVRDGAGAPLLLGVSEWLYVDTATLKIARLPPAFAALAPAGTPRVAVPEETFKVPDFGGAEWVRSRDGAPQRPRLQQSREQCALCGVGARMSARDVEPGAGASVNWTFRTGRRPLGRYGSFGGRSARRRRVSTIASAARRTGRCWRRQGRSGNERKAGLKSVERPLRGVRGGFGETGLPLNNRRGRDT
jgi:acyl-CoA thioesterase FadM